MCRTVTLLLVDRTGAPVGQLPPFPVSTPWWPEVDEVVAGVRDRYGLDVTVLRLVHAQRPAPHGGAVSYLAEVAGAPPPGVLLTPVTVDGAPRPHRAPWAVPGGPAASLAWADEQLTAAGRGPARPGQHRTWNLSAIWRFDGPAGPVGWLKQVPPFFAHEAAVLRFVAGVAPGWVPPLLAAGEQGRLLLDHVAGMDCHDAGVELRAAVAAGLHTVQDHARGTVPQLLAAGVPDRRWPVLAGRLRSVAAGHGAGIAGLDRLVDTLDERLAAIEACGLPETLVHGDLHPGNVRSAGSGHTVIDWGDSFVGHPGFDILRLADGLPDADAGSLLDDWAARWRATVPGCDPLRAVALLRPVAELHAAAVYAGFLAGIEESEWPYHASDVPAALRAAVAAL